MEGCELCLQTDLYGCRAESCALSKTGARLLETLLSWFTNYVGKEEKGNWKFLLAKEVYALVS